MSTETIINQSLWPRASHYEMFRSLAQPHFSTTVRVDATDLVCTLKPAGHSIFAACLFCIMRAANHVPELRTHFRPGPEGDTVVRHPVIHPSVTVPIENGLFGFCYFEHAKDWAEFAPRCRQATSDAKQQTRLTDKSKGNDYWLFLTCLPWLDFTSLTQPTNGPEDCFVRIAWGKLTTENGRTSMPVNIQVHHALADGMHVACFMERLQWHLSHIEETFGIKIQ